MPTRSGTRANDTPESDRVRPRADSVRRLNDDQSPERGPAVTRSGSAGRRRWRQVAVSAAVALLLAGCGTTAPSIGEQAARYRHTLRHGQVLGHLLLPRFHFSVPVRVGFDQRMLARGPGWFPGSRLPGEGRLVYIAGHHRTHGAPFRYVAHLHRGDAVVIATPYATATYAVTRRTTVSQTDFAVLRSPAHELLRLQTSTVPASSRRIVVTARLAAIHTRTRREP